MENGNSPPRLVSRAVRLLSRPPWFVRIVAVAGMAGMVLAVVFVYGVGVGRYQYAPYQQLAPILQSFPEFRQFLVGRSAGLSDESLAADETSHREEQRRLGLIQDFSDSMADSIVAGYKPYDLDLDSPIGYTIGHSVRSGESIEVYVHTTEPTSVEIHRLGRSKIKVASLDSLPERQQSPTFDPTRGLDWDPSFTLNTGGYRSGYYLIELAGLDSGSRYQIPLVVTPRQTPKVALVSQTNTWRAYNNFGGKGNYTDSRPDLWEGRGEDGQYNISLWSYHPQITHLPYARPYTNGKGNPDIPLGITFMPPLDITSETRPEDRFDGHLFRSEWPLAAFAEENELDYGIYTDRDLVVGGPLLEAEIIVINTHSEYWTQEMVEAIKQYIAAGGKVVFAGANTAWRKVKHTEYGMRVISQRLPSYVTTPFLGTSYTGDGFRTYGGYQVERPGHWVFAGAGVEAGDEIGVYSANQPAPGSLGEGGVGASGFETDKVNRYSEFYAQGFQTLAIGTNEKGPAYMVFKETESGGWIFHAASITFTGALFHDPVIDRLMLNLLRQTS